MTETCRAQAHRYIGKGPERVLHTGPCVLELGHDLDHLPYSLAAQQAYDQAFNTGFNAGINVAITKIDEGYDTPVIADVLADLIRLRKT